MTRTKIIGTETAEISRAEIFGGFLLLTVEGKLKTNNSDFKQRVLVKILAINDFTEEGVKE